MWHRRDIREGLRVPKAPHNGAEKVVQEHENEAVKKMVK